MATVLNEIARYISENILASNGPRSSPIFSGVVNTCVLLLFSHPGRISNLKPYGTPHVALIVFDKRSNSIAGTFDALSSFCTHFR